MQDTTLAMSVARCRIALGIVAIAAPEVVIRTMSGRTKSPGLTPLFVRMLGGRDIALGLGTVVALDHGAPVRGWIEGSALADTVDCLASVLARHNMVPRARGATTGLSGASAILGVWLSRRLDPPPAPHPSRPEAVATSWIPPVRGGTGGRHD
jgi:hypothetical protein